MELDDLIYIVSANFSDNLWWIEEIVGKLLIKLSAGGGVGLYFTIMSM